MMGWGGRVGGDDHGRFDGKQSSAEKADPLCVITESVGCNTERYSFLVWGGRGQ